MGPFVCEVAAVCDLFDHYYGCGRPGAGKVGAILTGRFSGQLCLLKRHADAGAMNMLLEVLDGLHFVEVENRGTYR